MTRIIAGIFLLFGLNLAAANDSISDDILINPYHIEVKKTSEQRYTISFQQEEFLDEGKYQDFNNIICDPTTKVNLVRLRKEAIGNNKYIIFNFKSLKEVVETKQIKTVKKIPWKNEETHEFQRVPRAIYYVIQHAENNANFTQVFEISNVSFPDVVYVDYTKSQLQRIPERGYCCGSTKTKGYYLTKNGASIKLLVANMDKEVAQTFANIFNNKDVTHFSVSEYVEQAVNKGVGPTMIVKVPPSDKLNSSKEYQDSRPQAAIAPPSYQVEMSNYAYGSYGSSLTY